MLINIIEIHRDLNIMKIVKGGRSSKNELLNIPFKLHWSDDTCTFRKGAIIKNESLHFTSDSERWEIKLIKFVAEQDEMIHTTLFDRNCFKRNLPDDYSEMSDTKLSRLLNKLNEWGLIHKVKYNQYQLMTEHIEDFAN